MFFYILRRLISVVLMLVVISITTFLIFYAGPTDPARLTCAKNCTAATIEGNRKALGFDKPIAVQYTSFLKGLVRDRDFPDDPELKKTHPENVTTCSAPCLGYSFLRNNEVTAMVKEALPFTVSRATGAFGIWIPVGVRGACSAALKQAS